MALNPSGPYPILFLQGKQGSAKSTGARNIKAMIDQSLSPISGRLMPCAGYRPERGLPLAVSTLTATKFISLASPLINLSDPLEIDYFPLSCSSNHLKKSLSLPKWESSLSASFLALVRSSTLPVLGSANISISPSKYSSMDWRRWR